MTAPSPLRTLKRARHAARQATRAADLVEILPLPPNAEELRLILDSIPGSQLPFTGNVRKQWRGAVRWLAWELARRGVRAPPLGLA